MNIDDIKTRPALELIIEGQSTDIVLDAIVDYIKTLEQRIETLENN